MNMNELLSIEIIGTALFSLAFFEGMQRIKDFFNLMSIR